MPDLPPDLSTLRAQGLARLARGEHEGASDALRRVVAASGGADAGALRALRDALLDSGVTLDEEPNDENSYYCAEWCL